MNWKTCGGALAELEANDPGGESEICRALPAPKRKTNGKAVTSRRSSALPSNASPSVLAIGPDGRYVLQNAVSRQNFGNSIGKQPGDFAPDEQVANCGSTTTAGPWPANGWRGKWKCTSAVGPGHITTSSARFKMVARSAVSLASMWTLPIASEWKWHYNGVRQTSQLRNRRSYRFLGMGSVRQHGEWSEETFQIFGMNRDDLKNHRQGFLERFIPRTEPASIRPWVMP